MNLYMKGYTCIYSHLETMLLPAGTRPTLLKHSATSAKNNFTFYQKKIPTRLVRRWKLPVCGICNFKKRGSFLLCVKYFPSLTDYSMNANPVVKSSWAIGFSAEVVASAEFVDCTLWSADSRQADHSCSICFSWALDFSLYNFNHYRFHPRQSFHHEPDCHINPYESVWESWDHSSVLD